MTRFSNLAPILVLFLFGCTEAERSGPIETSQGILEGTTAMLPGVSAYLGIPYAAPPIGDNRWAPPQPATLWSAVRKADTFSDRCMQTNPFSDMIWNSEAESEDCLYLNVWSRDDANDMPVMFWIHGGGFASGSGDEKRHDGSALASEDVVLVTINYRLGALGFLAHPELSAESERGLSGNYSLLDMVAALEWVQENIRAFGGDPDNVTIFGESAGSAAVSALMVSPLATGLFHKGIGQSASIFGASGLRGMSLDAAEQSGAAWASSLGAESIEDLRALPATDLIARSSRREIGFGLVLDGYIMPLDPVGTVQEGKHNDVPLMAGWTSAEIGLPAPDPGEFRDYLRDTFPERFDEALIVYPASTAAEAHRSAVDLAGDGFVVYTTWNWMQLQATSGQHPVYRFLFDQRMATPQGPVPEDSQGAGHASDIPFVFDTLESTGNPVAPEDSQVADLMVRYWTNFAKTSDPNGPELPDWPEYRKAQELMRLNAEAGSEVESDRARLEFFGMAVGEQMAAQAGEGQ